MNQKEYFEKIAVMRAVGVLALLPFTDDLPSEFHGEVSGIRAKAKERLTSMARECLGYAEGDIVTTPMRFPKAKVLEFFISDNNHLWVRVAGLKKDGSVGKVTDTFPALTGGVVKVDASSSMSQGTALSA